MLDLKFIRDNQKIVKEACVAKRRDIDLDHLILIDEKRRELLQEAEKLKMTRNDASRVIAAKKKSGEDASAQIVAMKEVSEKISALDAQVSETEKQVNDVLYLIPNIPHPDVPRGGPDKNITITEIGKKREFSFAPKTHQEIGEINQLFSFERAGKIAGSSFALFSGEGARLERSLINFMLDLHTTKHGYTELSTPYLVNRESMTGTGQLPGFEEDLYRLEQDDLFLIPTAEVPVTNYYRGELLSGDELPKKFTAYTACFRREAGSYGKETKGLNRLHQFDKVELVKFCRNDNSYDELESLREEAEEVLKALELPYRVVLLASGDMSFSGAKTYDLEVWAPGQNRWLEVSSCTNFEDYQARRMNIRYRSGNDKPAFVHTLNGSGIALPRTVIAILENYQNEDGTFQIPEALKPYMKNAGKA